MLGITYGGIRIEPQGSERDILTVAAKLLGDAWQVLFPAEPPKQTEVVPRQVVLLLHNVLGVCKQVCDTEGAAVVEAD